jgi:hypothetical protein
MSVSDELDLDSLDALFADAKAHLRDKAKAQAKAKKEGTPAKIEPSSLFSNPANWYAARSVALIHQESQTLLGHFRELLHRTVADCRRLVREDSPALIEAVEYVSGTWGWSPPKALDHQDSTLLETELTLFLSIAMQAQHSAEARIKVVTQGAGILRVELLEQTQFATEFSSAFLTLPSGINLLATLTTASKQAIREALLCQ